MKFYNDHSQEHEEKLKRIKEHYELRNAESVLLFGFIIFLFFFIFFLYFI